ncbi:MAG: Nicotinate-nucleotide--dimethylbenzimidazolephos phoribosyltransferase [Deltaproteobacteria bacterium]|nr:Nicotinate-nucleotide--dimethylbenzimidazolephos phoribosyltransferase [Deltaproteobacteria bacterium]
MSVLRHVLASISPASAAHAEAARQNVAGAAAPLLERLAALLGGAQHSARPRAARRTIVVCAGDHGVGEPGIALGAAHPTVVAATAIAEGSAALAQLARASRTPIVVVDAGAVEGGAMPPSVVRLGRGPSRDLLHEPAMTIVDAALGLEAGIALAVSLADDGLDVLAIGALGVGADVSSAALLGAALGAVPTGLGDPEAEAAAARGAARAGAGGLELLAGFGGPETAVLAGLVVAMASMNVPVILDGYATGAAALVAAMLAPAVRGYLIAAHTGSFTHPRILAHLGLSPVFEVGLGHGEGTGAAMVLPLIDQVSALSARVG